MRRVAAENKISPHLNYTESDVSFDVCFLAGVIDEIEHDYEISQMLNKQNTLFTSTNVPQTTGTTLCVNNSLAQKPADESFIASGFSQ